MAQSIIANRLNDGLVVFFIAPGQWTEQVAAAGVFEAGDAAEQQLALAKADETACLVVDPNLIDVEVTGDGARPTAIREAIRAFGPSAAVRTDRLPTE